MVTLQGWVVIVEARQSELGVFAVDIVVDFQNIALVGSLVIVFRSHEIAAQIFAVGIKIHKIAAQADAQRAGQLLAQFVAQQGLVAFVGKQAPFFGFHTVDQLGGQLFIVGIVLIKGDVVGLFAFGITPGGVAPALDGEIVAGIAAQSHGAGGFGLLVSVAVHTVKGGEAVKRCVHLQEHSPDVFAALKGGNGVIGVVDRVDQFLSGHGDWSLTGGHSLPFFIQNSCIGCPGEAQLCGSGAAGQV